MKSVGFANAQLRLILHGDAIPGVAANVQQASATLYLSLHTKLPEDNKQSSSEVDYPGYRRTAIARSLTGTTIEDDSAFLTNAVDFPEVVGGKKSRATHFTLGLSPQGEGLIFWKGKIDPEIKIEDGYIPRLKKGSKLITDR